MSDLTGLSGTLLIVSALPRVAGAIKDPNDHSRVIATIMLSLTQIPAALRTPVRSPTLSTSKAFHWGIWQTARQVCVNPSP